MGTIPGGLGEHMDVDRADISLWGFEVLITEAGIITVRTTWRVPYVGGFELVNDTPIPSIADTDWAGASFGDLTPTAEDAFETAGFTLTGTWPAVT